MIRPISKMAPLQVERSVTSAIHCTQFSLLHPQQLPCLPWYIISSCSSSSIIPSLLSPHPQTQTPNSITTSNNEPNFQHHHYYNTLPNLPQATPITYNGWLQQVQRRLRVSPTPSHTYIKTSLTTPSGSSSAPPARLSPTRRRAAANATALDRYTLSPLPPLLFQQDHANTVIGPHQVPPLQPLRTVHGDDEMRE